MQHHDKGTVAMEIKETIRRVLSAVGDFLAAFAPHWRV